MDQEELMTVKEVAALLRISAKLVRRLPIPRIKIGAKKLVFRLSDVATYIDQQTHIPIQSEEGNDRIQGGQRPMGVQVLPSREMLQAIRMGKQDIGEGGGGSGAH